jgi:hypothetical protein
MLYFNDVSWHIGEPVAQLRSERAQCHQAGTPFGIVADGDELEFILERTKNLPSANTSVVTWRGDLAKFIMDNVF